MKQGTIFGYEPALVLGTLNASLGLLVTLGVGDLTTEQAGWIVAAIAAVLGATTAAMTRPIVPAAFTTVVTTAAALVAAFGYEVPPEVVGALNFALVSALALITRGQVVPTAATRPPARPEAV